MDKIFIEGLQLECLIGVYEHERQGTQPILLDLEMVVDTTASAISDSVTDTLDYAVLLEKLTEWVSASCFNLLEALADFLAKRLFAEFSPRGLRLRLSKPNIISSAQRAGIEITRGQLHG